MAFIGIVAAGLAAGALLYWLLITTEGTYLGPRAVALLYDWVARRYDHIKDVDYISEARYLGIPLVAALGDAPHLWVLDVATGTGRVPLALLREPDFGGQVVGVDRSPGMLAQAQTATWEYADRVTLLRQDAEALAFADATFDGVTCLEALEFMLHPASVVRELVRVLKPGGLLLLTNRVGPDAPFYPARLCGRGRLEAHLQQAGLEDIRTQRWQVDYDLIWARRPTA
jgi:ubiquinone/menaquinone biosynthesis C-methylase UbiE